MVKSTFIPERTREPIGPIIANTSTLPALRSEIIPLYFGLPFDSFLERICQRDFRYGKFQVRSVDCLTQPLVDFDVQIDGPDVKDHIAC